MSNTPYQVMPALAPDEFEALKADIKARGVQVPVEYDEMGNILDGHHRVQACYDLGITHWPRLVRHGMTEEEKRRHARRLNLDRRHLNGEQKRTLIAAELKENPASSDRAIGAGLNVDHKTVGVVREGMETTGEIPQLEERQGRDNRTRRITQFVPSTPEEVEGLRLSVKDLKAAPNGARAIMGSRLEPDDSLDYFPTPPWATRALIEHVLPLIGVRNHIGDYSAWEPACGEGHIAEVLREYFGKVKASDIYDYGYGTLCDFLSVDGDLDVRADWIITNPPFGDRTEGFVLKALARAQYGVAMFVRMQWLETIGRYETIFRDHPPTKIAFFAERVPLCKGRWNPDGDTATAYVWLVWDQYEQPQPPFWIPPGCRDALTRADDVERFTAKPVTRRNSELPREEASGTAREAPSTQCESEPGEPSGLAAGSDLGTKSAPPQSDPIIRALLAAHRARRIFPAGHSFAMTNPLVNGRVMSVGTCSCDAVISYEGGSYELMDAAIEAHWQKFDHLPDKIDGRGNPINEAAQ